MSYEHLIQKDVDLSCLGFGDSLVFDFNPEKCLLRISVFNDFHFQDDVVVDLAYELGEKPKNEGTPIPCHCIGSRHLYRAKDVQTKQWVYGNFIDQVHGCVPLIVTGAWMQDNGDAEIEYHFVDKDTLEIVDHS